MNQPVAFADAQSERGEDSIGQEVELGLASGEAKQKTEGRALVKPMLRRRRTRLAAVRGSSLDQRLRRGRVPSLLSPSSSVQPQDRFLGEGPTPVPFLVLACR